MQQKAEKKQLFHKRLFIKGFHKPQVANKTAMDNKRG